MAEFAYTALVLAFLASLYATFAFIAGRRKKHKGLATSAGVSLYIIFGLVSLATLILLITLLTHQFEIEYVASYTSSDMSLAYLISALWAGNAGSLLFWAWLLTIFGVISYRQKSRVGEALMPYAASLTSFITAFFVLLLLTVANPFQKLAVAPAEGMGLNPLLENPGMILHPPALLAGYVALTIPFALAVAALLSGKLGEEWLVHARRWALLSWLLLGVGNIIGAWWAYVELGWGGYWAWDPVENAGLMPWLITTAFLHSIMIQRRKRLLKAWNMVLVILAFNLAIFGTFLTRSGILSSVHTFGNTGLEPFFLVFLNITFWGSWIIVYYRRKQLIDAEPVESILSREGTFQLNNLLLLGATLVIFIGTIFPAIAEAIGGAKITVGESFFNQVMGPVFLAVIFLCGICSVIGWQRRATGSYLLHSFIWPLVLSTLIGVLLIIFGISEWYTVVSYFFVGFALFTILLVWIRETRTRHQAQQINYFKSFWTLLQSNRARYGAYTVHIAIVMMAVGIIGSSLYSVEQDAYLLQGQSITIKDYRLAYQGMTERETPSKYIATATLDVYKDGKFFTQMKPEKLLHRSYEQPVTEVAIRTTAIEDLYIILAGWDADGTTVFRILVNPLVIWIWIGGGLLALGGLLVFWPQREPPLAPAPATWKPEHGPGIEDEIERQILARRKRRNFCPQCGTTVLPGDQFCAKCGARLQQGET